MKKKGRTPLGLARSRQTRSEINVQTPTGLQNMEMLINLGYDEIILLRSINYFFENEHNMYRDRMYELVFDLVIQVLDKIADETVAITEEEVLEYITKKEHPALAMDPMF